MQEDWVEVELGQICNIFSGTAFPKSIQGKKEGNYPFYKVGDISKNVQSGHRYLIVCDNYIDYDDIRNIESSLVPDNTIVFAKIGEALKLNRRGITRNHCLVDNNAIGIKAKFHLNTLYLYFYSQTIKLEKYSRATTVPSVRKTDIELIPVPLAPLPIQRAIVRKIETLFASLDKGISDLKTAQQQLKIYRQAVLKKAFEGRLTNKDLKEGELPEGWEWVKLGEVAEVKRGVSKHRPRNDISLFGGRYPFIQTGEVRQAKGGTIAKYKNTYSEKGLAQSKLWPKGTLCLTIAANIGETAFLGFDACFPDSVVGILAKDEVLDLKFFNLYIQKTKKEIETNASATAQKNINVEFLESIEFNLPTFIEQQSIVREIESRLSVCDKIEQSISEALEKAEALRQSILKKAFDGRLLSEEEIAACKREPDYEPAAVLLERIKKEKHGK